jgi:hypothetical protein
MSSDFEAAQEILAPTAPKSPENTAKPFHLPM